MFSLDGIAGTKSISNININPGNLNSKSTSIKGPLLSLNPNYKNWLIFITSYLYNGFQIIEVGHPKPCQDESPAITSEETSPEKKSAKFREIPWAETILTNRKQYQYKNHQKRIRKRLTIWAFRLTSRESGKGWRIWWGKK